MRWVLLVGFGFSLTACATAGGTMADRLAALQEFTVADGQAALAVAVKGGDKAGAQCLSYLVPKIAAIQQPAAPPTEWPGLLTQFETVRVAIHGQDTGPALLEEIDLNCAALRTSIEIDVAKGALLGASVAGSGGATAPGAIAKILPILMRLLRPGG
jgi:hypothetical protein